MTLTAAAAADVVRRPALDRGTAMRLAADEYARFITALRELDDTDWSRPTACPAWDVHAMACHVLGMAEMAASLAEQMRQMRAARKTGGLFIDALTSLQVAKHAHRRPAEVVDGLARIAPKAAAGRRRTPAPVRRVRLRDQPIEETGAATETWTLGYLIDVILTRDTWMHRSDIAMATGRPMTLTAEHDGILVADVVHEWAARHGQPYELTLRGAAGGSWRWDDRGPSYDLDAAEFCRILAGRGSGDGLLATRVPF